MSVVVLEADGTPRTDLDIADFQVLEDDVRQTIDHFRLAATRPTGRPDVSGQTNTRDSRHVATNAVNATLPQVRVVVRSADKRRTGVIVTEVNVPSWTPSQVWVSDPMVVDLSTGPGVSTSALSLAARIPASMRAALQVEVAGTHLDALEVDMTVRGDDGQPWQARADLLPGMTAHSRRASLSLPTGLLDRGHARVRVEARARGVKPAVRDFTIAVE